MAARSPKSRPEPVSTALASARRVLALEGAALAALGRGLDARFERAVEILAATKGRVAVTGMGKSGHIAGKIAATLASTGTPALFVHPAEAAHGDLGMVVKGDCVLALSNSGETPELAAIVAHTRRNGLPLVAVVGREASSLAEAADAVLALPEAEEACPMGLAPTTSTTLMLALGDALAVALLERKGFTAEEFHVLHPGGKLGRMLVRVSELMHQGEEMPLVAAGTAMADAILVMTAKRFGCVGVRDGRGQLAGVVTDGDLRRHMGDGLLARPVEAVMTRAPQTIGPRALAVEALRRMNERSITSLFAVEAGRPVGIVHIHDLLRAGLA
ncbi:MAG: KpsF/GutQ family sugar-phosphate isomerase [Alphaproteobacteria bacterium]|nr:KpsF/GutQ family sugar-phosphate isomerase [Alphaproteobacteria bacterium]